MYCTIISIIFCRHFCTTVDILNFRKWLSINNCFTSKRPFHIKSMCSNNCNVFLVFGVLWTAIPSHSIIWFFEWFQIVFFFKAVFDPKRPFQWQPKGKMHGIHSEILQLVKAIIMSPSKSFYQWNPIFSSVSRSERCSKRARRCCCCSSSSSDDKTFRTRLFYIQDPDVLKY